jgi:hypothetical protein
MIEFLSSHLTLEAGDEVVVGVLGIARLLTGMFVIAKHEIRHAEAV